MEYTAASFVSRVAGELGPKADELIADVVRCLRHEVPELWNDPDLARRTSEGVTENVVGVLRGLQYGIEPSEIEPPAAEMERARRLARRGTPVSVMLRAYRLGQRIVLDRLLAEMPRLTKNAELISAASRWLLATSGYVDHTSEQGVTAYQEERDRRLQWRLSLVNEAGKRVGTTLDIARTTQELADLAIGHFADLVTVDLLDPVVHGGGSPAAGQLVLHRVAQASSAWGGQEPTIRLGERHTCPGGSPSARALATGQPSRHTAAPTDPADAFVSHPTRSMLVVPLSARGATLGVARFSRHSNPDLFDDEDLILAQEIAARAAVAIDNARRYTHAHATAVTLQRSLLPRRTAEQSAVDVACRYLPAGAQAGVGGDWYDVIPLSGARVALVVGDVVGHGIHAAATMGRLRSAVRTLADIDLPPEELLTHLDDVVIRLSSEVSADPDVEAPGDIGATCLYAVYDPVDGRCYLARAGHVLPAVVTGDATVELLDLPPGPPLGLGGLPFEAAEVDLPEGSLLALYTDGLVEARDRDIEAGLTLLRHALAQPCASLEAACDTVLEALLPAGRADDDVALLLARTRALGDTQVAAWDVDADPAAVTRARSNAARQLTAWGLEELDFTTELVVSELVTNAIRYGRPPIRLRLIRDRSLLCEVSDASSTTPHLRRARVFDEGGRGLFLVAQLAERWGTRHARQGKTVWAELGEENPAEAEG
ncbi:MULTISPECIES: ATP-binding SpoIIE family protein phosphatase [Streptomyces]|uniref:Serine phosphatase RsbU (Regulator of sigma subunit)/anti-sigma regulatory factor (Ser/Thr protein kinase) n=1 Tax=Streptomyces stelliscabiei TaxID=146820 RepID=A0A8I0NZF0_9ACTN|nr:MULTISPECIES: SpoIIE family protein phosphatase [Streptomyces]KND23253.1 phosphatase [Streptomyces stelliscabiei]MBE1594047.1 serine phosphatase RsbU (regulator of sigma subunit)/anti-sigma regulatory factor (Ser/Thr protein kinase) [Streptomyces stelliscabiei]MDX2521488.1 SpoIIE family protein phosphatase [Streptomyces stelliscabiei]MDX3274839.1 SpoIIE family protein phosphatase [Streptomyces scabiei]